MMNFIKKTRPYIEIGLLCVIGFSPLIPQQVNAVLVVLLLLCNFKYVNVAGMRGTAATFLVLSGAFFAIGLVKDLLVGDGFQGVDPLSVYFPCTFALGFIMFQKYDSRVFMGTLSTIMTVFALFSLCGVVLYLFFPEMVIYLPLEFPHA